MANDALDGLSVNPLVRVFNLAPDTIALTTPYGKSLLTSPVHVAVVKAVVGRTRTADPWFDDLSLPQHRETRQAVDELLARKVLSRHGTRTATSVLTYVPDGSQEIEIRPVHVADGPGAGDIALCLERLGVPLCQKRETDAYTVAPIADYVTARSDDDTIFRSFRRKTPMIPTALTAAAAIVGPFVPDVGGCFMCVLESARELNEVDTFVAGFEELTSGPRMPAPGLSSAAFVATEVLRHCARPTTGVLNDHVLSLELATGAIRRHRVRRRTGCRYCQPPDANSPLRAPAPIVLNAFEKKHWTSGGMRVKSSSETLEILRELVSPLTGVVSNVTRVGDTIGHGDLHSFVATHPWNPRIGNADELRESLRHKSSGKGLDAVQAEVSAIAEAVERYSGVFRGDEIRHTAPLAPVDDRYVPHNSVALFSDKQISSAGTVGRSQHWTPPAPSDVGEVEWSPLWSLTGNRFRFLPTAMMYYFYNGSSADQFLPTSNGCASGNSVEEAIVQGFLELVERDAFAIWWYNRLARPLISETVIGEATLSHKRKLESGGIDVKYVDITTDLGIPAVAAVGVLRGHKDKVFVAAGCHFDVRLAALRASTELVQHLYRGDAGAVPVSALEDWIMDIGLSDAQPSAASVCYTDQQDEIERAKAVCVEHALDLLVLDQSRSHVNFPVVRVVVPGLRHHWPRLAPGRLYDVPVRLGWLAEARQETEMLAVPPE